jgi:hypothetical protein
MSLSALDRITSATPGTMRWSALTSIRRTPPFEVVVCSLMMSVAAPPGSVIV